MNDKAAALRDALSSSWAPRGIVAYSGGVE